MLAMEERALALKAKKPELDDLRSALGIDRIKVQVEELEQQAAQPGFWDDAEKIPGNPEKDRRAEIQN